MFSEGWLSSRLTLGIAAYSHWPGQAILCSCLDYYRLWYSFLSSLSHHEHVYLWPLVFISIVSDLSSLFPCFVNKCLQAIDSSLDSSLQIWAKCSANMRKTQCQCNQNCIANMSKVQFKYEPNPIQIWAKLNKNAIKSANMSKIQCKYEEDSGKESNQWIACWATTFAIPHYFYAMRQHLTLLQQSRYQHCAKNHNIWVPCCPAP